MSNSIFSNTFNTYILYQTVKEIDTQFESQRSLVQNVSTNIQILDLADINFISKIAGSVSRYKESYARNTERMQSLSNIRAEFTNKQNAHWEQVTGENVHLVERVKKLAIYIINFFIGRKINNNIDQIKKKLSSPIRFKFYTIKDPDNLVILVLKEVWFRISINLDSASYELDQKVSDFTVDKNSKRNIHKINLFCKRIISRVLHPDRKKTDLGGQGFSKVQNLYKLAERLEKLYESDHLLLMDSNTKDPLPLGYDAQ